MTTPPLLWIDHVLFSARDLDVSARRLLDEHGLASYDGGVHPDLGTANRIVPLGEAYLELLAVADHAVARGNAIGRWTIAATAGPDRPLHWNVGAADLEAVSRRRGLAVEPGRRTLPDGEQLAFRHLDTEQGIADPLLPLFIAWDVPPERHPGTAAVAHRVAATGIAWIELAVANAERRAALAASLDGAALPLRLVQGQPEGVRAVAIAVAGGPEIALR
jgi:Glyoxalase-like domain